MHYKYFLLAAFTLIGMQTSFASAKKLSPVKYKLEVQKPTVLPATNITETGFTANWEAVPGAEAYCVFVYVPTDITKEGDYLLIDEDFNYIDFGSVVEPVWHDEIYESLDEWTKTPNWSVYGYASFAGGMVSGVIYSPYFDATNDNGTYTVDLVVYGQPGDEIVVTSSGSTEEKQSFMLTEVGTNSGSLTFHNGIHDTYFTVINSSTESDFYLDEARVRQHLYPGDRAYVMVDLNEEVIGKTSADFKELPFAPGEKHLCYDLYAVTREYNDPNDLYDYEQYYSPFSDMEEVFLVGYEEPEEPGAINDRQAVGTSIKGGNGVVNLTLAQDADIEIFSTSGQLIERRACKAGFSTVTLNKGIYIVRTQGKTQKVCIF